MFRTFIAESIQQLRLADWNRVCERANDLLMHPDFLAAAEAGTGVDTAGGRASGCETRFWYVLAYQDDVPVGAACVTEYPLDTMVFASPLAQRVVGFVRRFFPGYLKFRVTFCGLPISTAGSNFRVAPGVDASPVVRVLNDAVEQIARERKTWVIVYKEQDVPEAALLEPLLAEGYVQAESLPMNRIVKQFDSFDSMVAAMRSHYRYKITKSRKKFAGSNLSLKRITGPAEIEAAYSMSLHAMYERVTRRAEHRLEILPREYFLELADRFPRELILTTISDGNEVLAFAWSMNYGPVYHNLFVGIDYDRNEESDVYFNLMVEDIAFAMDQPIREIMVGQTADDFKSRLGCTSDPRYLFIKVTNKLLNWAFRLWQHSILTPPPAVPNRDVFKQEPNQLLAGASQSS